MNRSCAAVRLVCFSVLGLCLLATALQAANKEKKGAKSSAQTAGAASATVSTLDVKNFVIGPEDVLIVRVWRDPEVSGQVVVRPDGKITLQLLGEIQAAGLTPEGLSQSIYDGLSKLKKTLDKSEVTVTVTTVNSRKYFIQGEVYRAGQFPLLVPTTVLEALGNAGGFREFANQKKIVILRKGGARFNFNYKEVVAGKKLEQNILLQPGDQIIVH
ncbi:MAG TPA: polysaccharide biosynthesis/export family protein [Bryobacteraceae bacterium]|jgi:polysaccharide biosynthesis/export protein|nr:polysaccharide biosynthesis/export family protein [Bryobacteraceae bacterium]